MRDFFNHHGTDLVKGLLGFTASVFGVVVSKLDQIEQVLRIAGQIGSLVVVVATVASICHKWNQKG